MNFYMKKYTIIAIIVLGIIFRLIVYIKGISFWGDEAMLAMNIYERSYPQLFKGLDYLQVAPPMFLVLSKILGTVFNTDFLRDYALRLIPLVSGIAAIPLFYKFLCEFTKNKMVILLSLFLFSFNMTAILYCAQFKQYSTELLIAIILFTIFYRILYKNDYKWYYSIIISLSPWFSLSSLFIIGSYFFLMIFKNYKSVLKIYLPFCISFCLFYFLYLNDVLKCNYAGMYNWWEYGYGFVDLRHPLRIVIRFGELFSFDKIKAICCGGIMLIVASASIITAKKDRLFLTLPIVFLLLASALKLYPIEARLTLFLLPLFVIIISEYNWKYKKLCLTVLCCISFVTVLFYTIHYPYKFCTSAKELIQIVESNIKPGDKIILDSAYHCFYYYLHKKDNLILLEKSYKSQANACNEKIETFPSGRYYLLVQANPKALFTNKVKILKTYNMHSTAIYFEK